MAWSTTTGRRANDLKANLDSLGMVLPGEVDGYRKYAKAAMPVVRLIFEAAAAAESMGLTRLALRHRMAGIPTLLSWSRRSGPMCCAATSPTTQLTGTAAVFGPMVWGMSPETPNTGLGALGHAMRHVARVRPSDRWQRSDAGSRARRLWRRRASSSPASTSPASDAAADDAPRRHAR